MNDRGDPALWTFLETIPGYAKRAAFEGEFFKGESNSSELHGRTDALVREVIQNSLDARLSGPAAPVRVRFRFSGPGESLEAASAGRYLHGLIPHLKQMGVEHAGDPSAPAEMPYLLIEDFGTKGLCGQPERDRDPDAAEDDQSFFWFWRNIGRSGKHGTLRGRWGLGKTVFPSASMINAFFGLTVRSTDGRCLLMGQAITQIHWLDGKEFVPEGYFHDPADTSQIQIPFESPDPLVSDFRRDFGISRDSAPGLSVVVPYPLEIYTPEDVLRSVIVHFFVPILQRQLIVEVNGEGIESAVIEKSTIESVADGLAWAGASGEQHHTRPPFRFAEWALERQESDELETLKRAGTTSAPQWTPDLFLDGQLDSLRKRFSDGERIAVRVPITVELKDGTKQETYFDAFLEKDSDVTHGEDHFVRGGMTISKVATLRSQRGTRGLVLVDDQILSSFLGDAEGPAHTEWSESEDRPNVTYARWKSRLRFVKHSLKKLVDLISPPPEGLDTDLLQDIFSIEDPRKTGSKKRRKRNNDVGGDTPDPPDPPEPRPPILTIQKLEGNHGFRIRGAEGAGRSKIRVRVRAAYAVPSGNPFARSNYSPFDFVFDKGKAESVRLTHSKDVQITTRRWDSFVFETASKDFEIEAVGFDPVRDLVIDTKLIEE